MEVVPVVDAGMNSDDKEVDSAEAELLEEVDSADTARVAKELEADSECEH